MSIPIEDDGSRVIAQDIKLNDAYSMPRQTSPFEFYDITQTVDHITSLGASRIALQFPDELLPDAYTVLQLLQRELDPSCDLFILGDTSYGSCCVDEVAAQHLQADCIVHFGEACLSPTSLLPVVYVFGNQPFTPTDCLDAFLSIHSGVDVVLLFECGYHYAMPAFLQSLPRDIRIASPRLSTVYSPASPPSVGETVASFGGVEVDVSDIDLTTTQVFFVGSPESRHLANVLMQYSSLRCHCFDPRSGECSRVDGTLSKTLMRRFYLVEKARQANIVGILVGTLAVQHYVEMVAGLRTLLAGSGRKSYTFVVGKINVEKLANYAEIDCFVIVACPRNSLIDCKEFYRPIVTPHEMEMACGSADAWTGQYLLDFKELLPRIHAAGEKEDEGDEPFYSMATGKYESRGRGKEREVSGVVSSSQVISYESPAGDFLATRTYQGLEPSIGESEPHRAMEGKIGTARDYSDVQ
jgi:diphthamide biosynthesis protein 2